MNVVAFSHPSFVKVKVVSIRLPTNCFAKQVLPRRLRITYLSLRVHLTGVLYTCIFIGCSYSP